MSCMLSYHGGLFVAYWPSMTGGWGDRGAKYQLLIGQCSLTMASDWSVMTLGVSGGQCSITCSAGGQASGPEIMQASDWSIPGYWPLIGCRGDIAVGQATWSTTGLAWTMGTRTL